MTTDVSIASNALVMLGDKPIATFEDSTLDGQTVTRASVAANLWPSVRDAVIRSHPWNCCIKRVSLLPNSEAPAFDFRYQFDMPGDCLRVLSMGELGRDVPYKLEGGKILCDYSPCRLRYLFANTNAATYDSLLVDLLTVTMASRMAYAITQSAALADAMAQRADAMARKARAVDGQEDTADPLGDDPLMRARRW